MPSLTGLLFRWPVIRQICERVDGTGLEAMSGKKRAMQTRIDNAQLARSICPCWRVGCGQLIFHKNGKLVPVAIRQAGQPEACANL